MQKANAEDIQVTGLRASVLKPKNCHSLDLKSN